jgi:hypothetical protein
MIRKVPKKHLWKVSSETTGRSFGVFRSKAAARNRLRQVEWFKKVKK